MWINKDVGWFPTSWLLRPTEKSPFPGTSPATNKTVLHFLTSSSSLSLLLIIYSSTLSMEPGLEEARHGIKKGPSMIWSTARERRLDSTGLDLMLIPEVVQLMGGWEGGMVAGITWAAVEEPVCFKTESKTGNKPALEVSLHQNLHGGTTDSLCKPVPRSL